MKYYLLPLLCVSTASIAGVMGDACSKENVSIPCAENYWKWAGHSLYIQPLTAVYGPMSQGNGSQQANLNLGTTPTWSFGFQLEMAYHFYTGNDMNLNWYHFRSQSSTNLPGPVQYSNLIVAVPFATNPTHYDSFSANAASAQVKPQWDQVNIEFAKRINLGQSDWTRLHGGVNYSRVGSSGQGAFSGSTSLNNTLTNYDNSDIFNTVYNGFGVRTGADLEHDFNNGLSIYAKGAASVLAGMGKSSHHFFDNINGKLYTGMTTVNRARVVPELDGRVGVNYTYEFFKGDLNADIGWIWANYFNALSCHDYNFGIQGLYFGLKWIGHLI